MKKALSVLFALGLILSLCACSNADSKTQDINESSEVIASETKIISQADSDPAIVNVNVYSYLVKDKSEEEIRQIAEENGYVDFAINEDGSVTFSMTEEKRLEKVNEFQTNIYATVDEIMNLDTKIFQKIDCDDSLTQIKMYVAKDNFSVMYAMYGSLFLNDCASYQAFSGIPSERFDLFIDYVDSETEEVVYQSSYRETINKPVQPEETTAPTEPEAIVVELGQTYTVDDVCTFTITGYEVTDAITRNGMQLFFGKHTKTTDSTTLLLIKADFTNNGTEALDIFQLIDDAELVYQNTYSYEGCSAGWDDALPLAQVEAYFVFNIPKTVAESGELLVTTMDIGGTTFTHTVQLAENEIN